MTSPGSAATPVPTQTALVALVPAAEPAVARHRAHLDGAARWGVPAHVSVLYPFVPPGEVDDELLARLSAAVSTVPAFDVAFHRTAWFGQDVLWLVPEPAQPFRDLTTAVASAFPDHPPYAGAFDGSTPHLTIGERRSAGVTALRRAEGEVLAALPIRARVEQVQLLSGADAPDSWSIVHGLPLS